MATTTTTAQAASTTYVVPCGAAKLDHAAPAAELYTGAHFQWVLRSAIELADGNTDRVRILSARYGLVRLDQVLEPYDEKMTRTSGVKAERIADQLDMSDGTHQHHIVMLLPRAYAERMQAAVNMCTIGYRATWAYEGCGGIGEQRGRVAELVRHHAQHGELPAEPRLIERCGLCKCDTCGEYANTGVRIGQRIDGRGPVYWSAKVCTVECHDTYYQALAELDAIIDAREAVAR